MSKDTIFALATPYAKSGVAIIRLSGPQARDTLVALTGKQNLRLNMAHYCAFSRVTNHESRTMIDRGLAFFFQAPHSSTGEDIAEFHIHGSLAVIREMLETLGAMEGLRHAEPGEFSRRAFLNGKMDLVEAEGLADLIDAETPRQKAQALAQMRGDISRHYDGLRARIIQILAQMEAYIDFPDEDIPESALKAAAAGAHDLKTFIRTLLNDAKRGERMREGIRIVILGAPNAGKSSLLNALAGREAAIVSHRAGTTRDAIEVHMDIGGFPVILTDTAGLREHADEIEAEGVRRAKMWSEQADIKLLVFDGVSWPELDNHILELSDNLSIHIISKSDLILTRNYDNQIYNHMNFLFISSKTAEGIDDLLNNIQDNIAKQFSGASAPLITRTRHRGLLNEALARLECFNPAAPTELACEELRWAAAAIGRITGKITADDVLDVVFREFCIGK